MEGKNLSAMSSLGYLHVLLSRWYDREGPLQCWVLVKSRFRALAVSPMVKASLTTYASAQNRTFHHNLDLKIDHIHTPLCMRQLLTHDLAQVRTKFRLHVSPSPILAQDGCYSPGNFPSALVVLGGVGEGWC